MRCRLGIHKWSGGVCFASCVRCGAQSSHRNISRRNQTTTYSDWLGPTRTEFKEWEECANCGWKSKPTKQWSRNEREANDG